MRSIVLLIVCFAVTTPLFAAPIPTPPPGGIRCEDTLLASQNLGPDLLRDNLNRPVHRVIQFSVPRFESSTLADLQALAKPFDVEVSVTSVSADSNGVSVQLSLSGLGRDVLRALLEMTGPKGPQFVDLNKSIYLIPPNESAVITTTTEASNLQSVLSQPVRTLPVASRILNVLRRHGIDYIGDLVMKDKQTLKNLEGLGQGSRHTLNEALATLGLKLGMTVSDWPYENLDPNPWSSLYVRDANGETLVSPGFMPLASGEELMTLLSQPIDDIQIPSRHAFSFRTENALRNEGVRYVGSLVQYSPQGILRIPNLGRKSLKEIEETLASMHLKLGMETPGWSYPGPVLTK